MLPVLRRSATKLRPAQSRSLVSYLLTKDFESHTVSQLRQEAKSRGLTQTGNKSTLVQKLQEHDRLRALQDPNPVVQQVRKASTVAPPAPTATTPVAHPVTDIPESAVPADGAVAPGIPPEKQTDAGIIPTPLTHLYVPDLSQPDPEIPVQVPYLPDYWDSMKTRHSPSGEVDTSGLTQDANPKMVVVAGGATHHGGGPSHNLHTHPESAERHLDPAHFTTLSHELLDRWGFPSIGLPNAEVGEPVRLERRKLDEEETTGLYYLLAGFASVWLLSGLVTPKSKVQEVSDTKNHSH